MTTYIRSANPIWFFNDLTGFALNDQYWAFFLKNDLPYNFQDVFQDPDGATLWSNPIQFLESGGLPDNIYFDSDLVYRIEIRQGSTQADPLIYPIQNYVPGDGGNESVITDVLQFAENMIQNPQFSDIYFVSPFTFTQSSPSTYTVEVGPGWYLELVGTGTTVLTQGTNAGDSNLQGNPVYFLTINNSGWTTANLIQKFSNNGAIFSGGAVAIALDANATSSPEALTVSYEPSTGTPVSIFSAFIPTGGMQSYKNAINIPFDAANTATGTSAYVNINFTLPATGILSLSNIQLVGQSIPLSDTLSSDPSTLAPLYQEETYERIVDHEFNTYKNSILFQPKDTVLVGWNFPQNPWQDFPYTGSNVAANQYAGDQTLIVQQAYVASATMNNISVAQDGFAASQTLGYQVSAVTAHNQFAMIQYIDPVSIGPFWRSVMSSVVSALIKTTHASTVRIKMRLIYSTSLPGITSQTIPISSWTEGGNPIFDAQFTELKPINDPVYTISSDTLQDFVFEGFELPINLAYTQTLGIVLYTLDNMDETATADYLVFKEVSLVPNRFAIPSNAKTYDETVSECYYYFQTSYERFVLRGANSPISFLQSFQQVFPSGSEFKLYSTAFSFQYPTLIRQPANIILYSPTGGGGGAANKVDVSIYNNTASALFTGTVDLYTYWAYDYSIGGTRASAWFGNSQSIVATTPRTAGFLLPIGQIRFHYVLDARLGLYA